MQEIALKQVENTTVDADALVNSQSALMEYIPKSDAPYVMETLVPRNLAFETQVALTRIVKDYGNIDHLVRDRLRYNSLEDLWKAFSAEQVDALGLYIKQFDMGKSLIIADATGIGKGREAGGVIRHAVMEEYLPIFFTQKVKLFSDIYRDVKAIDLKQIDPFILNTDSQAKIKDADGSIVYSSLSSLEQKELLTSSETVPTDSDKAIAYYKSIGRDLPDPDTYPELTITHVIDHVPNEYDMIFSTYSQLQSAAPYKYLWLKAICEQIQLGNSRFKGVVFVLDECHTIGSHETIIGQAMLSLLSLSHSCCFLSATFAKYPQVMPIYAGYTAIAEAKLSNDAFVRSMKSGGLALQEIISPNLAEMGQLISRQRSSEGIETFYEVLDQEPERSLHRKQVDRIIKIMRRIAEFESQYLESRFAMIHSKAKSEGDKTKQQPRNLGVKQSPYFSRVFGIVDQMLFALKAESVAKKTLELLEQDKKVVIAFKSTMGAFLNDLQLGSGDTIPVADLDFVHVLQKGLDSIFQYSYTTIDNVKSRERIPLEDLSVEAQTAYEALKSDIRKERSGLMISPIDILIDVITKAQKSKNLGGHKTSHFKVGEVTGRKQRLIFEGDHAIVQSFRSDSEKAFRLFNSGEYDVLLINQSGSTGASAHASKDFKDQRKRALLMHQFELDINTVVQILGRVNRTGQVVLPEYYYITSDIPMEARLLTMLKAKLKTLDANTTGSQKTRDDTLKSPDFLNKYGDTVAHAWIKEHPELMPDLGYPNHTKVKDDNGYSRYVLNPEKHGAIRQLTGRAGLLLVKDQESLYDELLSRYKDQIQLEKQQGTYDLEVEFLQLDAEVQKRFLFHKGVGGLSAFGRDTIREQTIVNNLNRPFTGGQVEMRILKALEGKPPETVQAQLLAKISLEYPEMVAKRELAKKESIEKLSAQMLEYQLRKELTEEDEQEIKLLKEIIDEKQQSLDKYLRQLETTRKRIESHIGLWQIGDAVKVPSSYSASIAPSWGVFLGVSIGKSAKNPYTLGNIRLNFAVTDSRKALSVSLNEGGDNDLLSAIFKESKSTAITEREQEEVLTLWNNRIKEASAKREQRQILTENILASAGYIDGKNRLIKYNTKNGAIQSGILLSRDTDASFYSQSSYPISEALSKITDLAIGGYFKANKDSVRFEKISASTFNVFLEKKELYKAIIDPELQKLLIPRMGADPNELPDFVQNGNEMTGVISLSHLPSFLNKLNEYGIYYFDGTKQVKELKEENEKDWRSRTERSKERYVYELGTAYGKSSHPSAGFENFFEGDGQYPLGRVVYNRRLSDKERYNFTLIPVFKNATESYTLWKNASSDTKVYADFLALVETLSDTPLFKAIETLGYFIFNHPHESGNTEFVFGRYSALELGKASYSQEINEVTPLTEFLAKLQLHQELEKIV
ncbi:strawberry notch C-terminal domain-containing protein [Dokdonia ponticola]|uniref:Strawberry notch C-terminal domain-containing protein n=1 Tax=Dokdonia ponticola TaxID=2041041 RepID=A0ABV9I1K8_9FLAO